MACELRGYEWCTVDLWWLMKIFCLSRIVFFKYLCVSFTYETTFIKEVLLYDLYNKRVKRCVIDLGWPRISQFIWAKMMFPKLFFCLILLSKEFSMIYKLRKEKMYRWGLMTHVCCLSKIQNFFMYFCVSFLKWNNVYLKNLLYKTYTLRAKKMKSDLW